MATLPKRPPSVNPTILQLPPVCTECDGSGRAEGSDGWPVCCDTCDGMGRVVQIQESPPVKAYTAWTEGDCLDEGGPLEDFVGVLLATFPQITEDIAIWHERRIVAIIRPNGKGKAVATWV